MIENKRMEPKYSVIKGKDYYDLFVSDHFGVCTQLLLK